MLLALLLLLLLLLLLVVVVVVVVGAAGSSRHRQDPYGAGSAEHLAPGAVSTLLQVIGCCSPGAG
jgi:NADH:ubiquinone oxidoreductase subunit 3 (subunit A)